MLTLFRNLVRSKVALILIGLLIFSLAMFGVPDLFASLSGNKLGNSLMRADSERLEVQDVERASTIYLNRINGESGTTTKQDLAETGQLARLVESLAFSKVQNAYYDSLDISSSKTEFVNWLREIPALRNEVTNEFDPDYFQRWLSNQGFRSESEFQKNVADEFTQSMVSEGIESALTVPSGIKALWSLYDQEKRDVAVFTVSFDDIPVDVAQPTEDEIKSVYVERQDALTQPERRQFSVIAVKAEDFEHKIELDEETLRNEYQAEILRFTTSIERTYDTITFQDKTDAQDALGKLLIGTEPSDIAGIFTSFEATKRDQLVDAKLSAAVFDKPIDVWNGPIETIDGSYKLVRGTSQTEGIVTPFEDVSEILREELAKKRAVRQVNTIIDELDDAVGAGLSLEEMSSQVGTPVYTFPPVDRRGITEDGQFVRSLAELDGALALGFTLFPGDSSDRRETTDIQFVVRLDKIIDPFVPELDVIKDDLRRAVFNQNRQSETQAYLEDRLSEVRNGEATFDSIAESLGVDVFRPGVSVTRTNGTDYGIPSQLLGLMFGSRPDTPFITPVQTGLVVGIVENISYPSANELDAISLANQKTVEDELLNDLMGGLAVLAEQSITVETNQPQIEAYISQSSGQE